MGKKALITGINGFTGRYLQDELAAAGWDVWGCDRQAESEVSCRYLTADLTDFAGLCRVVEQVRPDAVAHLAGVAFVGHDDAEAFYRVNLLGTRNLLVALASLPTAPAKILLASSANVYGNSSAGILKETTPVCPANDYAVSKLAMEHMAALWTQRLPIIIARPFNYTGVGQEKHFVIPKLVHHFQRQTPVIELGNIDVAREFNDVRMVCAAYRLLLEHGEPTEIYNVCTGHSYTLRQVLDELTAITGQEPEIRINQEFVRSHEVKKLCGEPGRLRNLDQSVGGGWLPSYRIEDTLAAMLSITP